MPNGSDWVAVLSPIAKAIFSKITSGQKISTQEQQFALMFTLIDTTASTQREMVALREDFNHLCTVVQGINAEIGELAKAIAFLMGRMEHGR